LKRNNLQTDNARRGHQDKPCGPAAWQINTLTLVTPQFILPDLWSTNSPDLNPVNYTDCDCLQGRVSQKRVYVMSVS